MSKYKELDFLGYPGYRIHNDGILESSWKSLGNAKGFYISNEWKIITGSKHKDGYLQVRLSKVNSKKRIYLLHRLVAIAFIEKPHNKHNVLHNNGIPTDNRVENLRWGNQKENIQDAKNHGTFTQKHTKGINNHFNKLNESKVKEIKLMINKSISNIEIAKQFNVSKSLISAIKRNIIWKHI